MAEPTTPSFELTLAQQRQLVRALLAVLACEGAAPHHIETHISHVLLHDGHAYKIKKALANAFLDQSTLARRRVACDEELRLNRRLAPELYLDVVAITGSMDAPVLGGDGQPLDVAVRMRAFNEDGLWDRLATRGELRAEDIDDLAALLARFHAQAAVARPDSGFGTPAQVRSALLDSLRDLQAPTPASASTNASANAATNASTNAWPSAAERARLVQLQNWEAQRFLKLQSSFQQRLATGHVREGHGDLHLGNVAREAGRCLVFDGIEFNAEFRWIDVMSELAFMAMDLHAHALPALAHRLVNTYLEHSGDHDGLRVFGYYLVHRALVRAKVAQLRASQGRGSAGDEARAAASGYLSLASQLALPRPQALMITHGLSGSGKTTLTQALLETIGAVRIRADVERKRLAGLAPLQSSRSLPGAGIYSKAMNEATYGRLLAAASTVLEAGWPVILDATFLRHGERAAARRCAAERGVPFVILHFTAQPEVLRERIRQRAALAQDASEANEAVLSRQLQWLEPLRDDELPVSFAVRSLAQPGVTPAVDWTPLLTMLNFPQPHQRD